MVPATADVTGFDPRYAKVCVAPDEAESWAAWPPPLPVTSESVPPLPPHPESEPEPLPSNVPFLIRFVAADAVAVPASAAARPAKRIRMARLRRMGRQ